MKTTDISEAGRTARNIAKKHGIEKLVRLIELFQKNTSGEEIAQEYGVTRQRVHQWRHRLGITHFTFVTDPGVLALIASATST